MRIATYNIHRAVGADRQRDPARIARVVAALDADVVGLQEVDWHHDPSGAESPYEVLRHLPGYEAVPGANLRDHRGDYGNLLVTRLPVRAVRRFDISIVGREPRGVIDVDIEAGGGVVRVLVSHLGLKLRERRAQTARIAAMTGGERPTLLLADLNEWLPGAPGLRPLQHQDGPAPASFPARLPLLALDRVMVLGGRLALRVHAERGALARRASDHLPVIGQVL